MSFAQISLYRVKDCNALIFGVLGELYAESQSAAFLFLNISKRKGESYRWQKAISIAL